MGLILNPEERQKSEGGYMIQSLDTEGTHGGWLDPDQRHRKQTASCR